MNNKELRKKYAKFNDVFSPVGILFTKKFLKNKNIKIVSEGDFVNRVQICTAVFYSLLSCSLIFSLLVFFKISLTFQLTTSSNLEENFVILLKNQLELINIVLLMIGFNLVLLISILIFFKNYSLGKKIKFFTYIFNFLFIAQLLFFSNFIFVLDWFGLLSDFNSLVLWVNLFMNWWLWILVITICLFTYKVYLRLFTFINALNREWTRISLLKKTGDKENSFVFKFWIHPNENRARKLMITAGSLGMVFASAIHLVSIFAPINLDFMKYFSLILGIIVISVAFLVPYNKFSFYIFGAILLIYTGITIYSLVEIQSKSYLPNHWYLFIYLFNVIIWCVALSSNINIWIAVLNKINVYAVVVKPFNSVEEFHKSVENFYNQKNIDLEKQNFI